MTCKPAAVFVCQRNGGTPAEFGARLFAETGRKLGLSLVVEGHECAVEPTPPGTAELEAVRAQLRHGCQERSRAFYSVEPLDGLTEIDDKALQALRHASAIYEILSEPPS